MSMINEQVKELREYAEYLDWVGTEQVIRAYKLITQAANTIEELSAKLQETNTEQSISRWISCSERLPNKAEYLKDDGRFILDDGNRRYQGLFDIYDGKFKFSKHVSEIKYELIEDKSVIAWCSSHVCNEHECKYMREYCRIREHVIDECNNCEDGCCRNCKNYK